MRTGKKAGGELEEERKEKKYPYSKITAL